MAHYSAQSLRRVFVVGNPDLVVVSPHLPMYPRSNCLKPFAPTGHKDTELVGDINRAYPPVPQPEEVVGDDEIEVLITEQAAQRTMCAYALADNLRQGTQHSPYLTVPARVGEFEQRQFDHLQIGEMAAKKRQRLATPAEQYLIALGKVTADERDTTAGMPKPPVERCDKDFHSGTYDDLVAFVCQRPGDGVHLLTGDFLQGLDGRGTVDNIDHYLLRAEPIHRRIPRLQLLGRRVVYTLNACGSRNRPPQETGLERKVAVELRQQGLYLFDRKRLIHWLVDKVHGMVYGGVQLQDTLIRQPQRFDHIRPPELRSVGEDRHFGTEGVSVAQGTGIGDNRQEIRMERRLTIAAESNDIYLRAIGLELLQPLLEGSMYLFGSRQDRVGYGSIESALAVNTIECAEFVVERHKFHAERYAEPPRVYRTIDDIVE